MIARIAIVALAALLNQASAADARVLASENYRINVEQFAQNLANPWGLAFLPDGNLLVTERPGRMRLVDSSGRVSKPLKGLKHVTARGQGGLLDVTVDPKFAENRTIYYCHAERRPDGGLGTSVTRARLSEDGRRLTGARIIFRQLPSQPTAHHFGCRLVFDKVGALFVTLGDRGNRPAAQRPGSHIGKVVRIAPEGGPALGNPNIPGWRPEIWSIGHRNVQGATLDEKTGQLWTVEHGARGGDEINRPEAGKNYGWPVISYGRHYSGDKIGIGTHKSGMEQPVYYWDPSIAPSGLSFYTGQAFPKWQGNLFVGALKSRHLARLVIENGKVVHEEQLLGQLGLRIRAVVEGPDGFLYVLVDSAKGAILRLKPAG